MDDAGRQLWGPYEIVSVLGRGGMGVVFRARHAQTGQEVALKTLAEPQALLILSLRREIQTLKRLTHPGVVRILDSGVREGVPWMALELLRGLTLGEHIEFASSSHQGETLGLSLAQDSQSTLRMWATTLATTLSTTTLSMTTLATATAHASAPLAPVASAERGVARLKGPLSAHQRDMLGWVGQVCRALAYLHGEGVVHCDVKPDNILITEDGRAVLMDFGIVAGQGSRVDHDALAMAGMRAGTAHTISPECIQGQGLDGRADLYAVGCMLYEIVSGRAPFDGASVAQILEKHLSETPPSPGDYGVEVPAALEDIIVRLLARSPRDRPSHALAVLRALEAIGVDTGVEGASPPKPHLLRAPLVGRQEVASRLEGALSEAIGGRGRAVMIGGEGGQGKTRLAAEVVERARARGVPIFVGRGSEGALSAFIEPLRMAADVCLHGGEEVTARIIGDRGPVLAPFAPFLRSLPGQAERPEPAPLPLGPARLRVFRALSLVLESADPKGQLLLIVDDLHLADPLSIEALSYFVARSAARPWLILGIYNVEHAAPGLEALLQQSGVDRLTLEPLRSEEVEALIAGTLGVERCPARLREAVEPRAEGNPHFVVEYLSEAVARGWLAIDPAGQWALRGDLDRGDALPVPEPVRALVTRRIDALTDAERRVCEAAAILGGRVDVALLEQVAMLAPGDFDGALDVLLHRRILSDGGVLSVALAQGVAAEIVMERLDASERVAHHARAAAALEGRARAGQGVEMAQLARHLEGSGQRVAARGAWLQAGHEVLARYAVEEAEGHMLAGLALFEEVCAESLKARLDLASLVYAPQGRVAEAEAHWRGVAEGAREIDEPSLLASSLVCLGRDALTRAGRHKEAFKALREGRAIHARLGDIDGVARALFAMANLHVDRGRHARALELYAESLALYQRSGNRVGEGAVVHNIANIALSKGNHVEAMEMYLKSLEIDRELGDRRGESVTLNNMASAFRSQGRLDESRAFGEASLALRRAVVDRRGEGVVLNNLANIHLVQGHYEEGLALYSEALEIRREVLDRRGEGITRHNMANIDRLRGRFEEARAGFDEALAIHREVSHRRGEAVTRLCVACIDRDQGDPGEAMRAIEEALALAVEVGDRDAAATAELEVAVCLRLLGRIEEADARLSRASEDLAAVKDRHGLARCHCERGMIRVAQGQPAADDLRAAVEAASLMGVLPGSEVGRAISALSRAIKG